MSYVDDMSSGQLARYVEWAAVQRELDEITRTLQDYERRRPGTVLAVAGMTADAQRDFLWSLRCGNRATELGLDERLRVYSETGDGIVVSHPLVPTPSVPAVALTTSGHCPVGSECDTCRWEAMTPMEREEMDRRWRASAERRRSRRATSASDQEDRNA